MPTKDRLRALRLEANRTQIQLAKLLHIEGRTYQRLELEDVLPSTRHLLTLSDFYQVSVDYLLCRTDRREVNR